MANHKQALKRHRQSLKAQSRNRVVKSHIKKAVKNVLQAIEAKDPEQARIALQKANSVYDKAATKGVIHWRNATRHISRLTLAVNKLEQ
ncbi:MAG: 30S ribosomal protein S20 [Desulfohalobiaceae bacterium]|nr:30S ribosomal protein S20 [Desulfohalobiaceae bacterium]